MTKMYEKILVNMFSNKWTDKVLSKWQETVTGIIPILISFDSDNNNYIYLAHLRQFFEDRQFSNFSYQQVDEHSVIFINPGDRYIECIKAVNLWKEFEQKLQEKLKTCNYNESFWEGSKQFINRISKEGGKIEASVNTAELGEEITILSAYKLWVWMEKNLTGSVYLWTSGREQCWRFEEKNDAVLFKVTWSGQFKKKEEAKV